MRILLDTHFLIWAVDLPGKLPPLVRETLEDPENDIYFSVVSIWEIAIKSGLNRSDFQATPRGVAGGASQIGFSPLTITVEVACSVRDLPRHHRDPFDRLLVAQALAQPARLLTADPMLARYSELVWLEPT